MLNKRNSVESIDLNK